VQVDQNARQPGRDDKIQQLKTQLANQVAAQQALMVAWFALLWCHRHLQPSCHRWRSTISVWTMMIITRTLLPSLTRPRPLHMPPPQHSLPAPIVAAAAVVSAAATILAAAAVPLVQLRHILPLA
jgi:hypothetical protein